jgi:Zn-dependent membrane protease YugP
MTSTIILIISLALVIYGYIKLLITYILNKNKKYKNKAYEVVIKLLDDESSINLIGSKESSFSKYNIKRKMVKLSENTYDNDNIFRVSVASMLSGCALSKSKYLQTLSTIFKELKVFSYSAIICIIISILTTNMGDAKISIVLVSLIAVYQYILNLINAEALDSVDVSKEVNVIMNTFNKVNNIFFISSLVQIVRLVVIILNM